MLGVHFFAALLLVSQLFICGLQPTKDEQKRERRTDQRERKRDGSNHNKSTRRNLFKVVKSWKKNEITRLEKKSFLTKTVGNNRDQDMNTKEREKERMRVRS